MKNTIILLKRDLKNSINTRMFVLISFMVLLQLWFILGSGAVKDIMKSGQMNYMSVVFSFNFFGSVAALAYNFDSISIERENKIMDLILTANVSKKQVFLSKILNSFIISAIFAVLYVIIILLIYLVAIKNINISLMTLRYIFPITVFMFIYNLMGMMLSIVLRSSKTSFIISVIIGGLFIPRLFVDAVNGLSKILGLGQKAVEIISLLSPALIMNSLNGYAKVSHMIIGLLLFIIYSTAMILLSIIVFSKQDELNYGE